MFSFDNLLVALEFGNVLLDRKMYTISVSGSAQTIVPVKPVCPKLAFETHPQVGPSLPSCGLSNPSPRRFPFSQKWHVLNVSKVVLVIYWIPP